MDDWTGQFGESVAPFKTCGPKVYYGEFYPRDNHTSLGRVSVTASATNATIRYIRSYCLEYVHGD